MDYPGIDLDDYVKLDKAPPLICTIKDYLKGTMVQPRIIESQHVVVVVMVVTGWW